MIRPLARVSVFLWGALAPLVAWGGNSPGPWITLGGEPLVASNERLITILATNDIHGALGAETDAGRQMGGLPFFAGAVEAFREGYAKNYGQRAGVVVLDAGDQFQGSLMSNFDEGHSAYKAMSLVGYDAALLGNHAFDFGPVGWLQDKVDASTPQHLARPRGALESALKLANFPMLAANMYLKNSLVDAKGRAVGVDGVGCRALAPGQKIAWAKARRPEIVTPYVTKDVAGVRVAIIGIEDPVTPRTTTADNVADLCFRDEIETYLEIRHVLARSNHPPAVYILLVHEGDRDGASAASSLARDILKRGGPEAVHAVVAGHTHKVHIANGVAIPLIQSGTAAQRYGRIDLVVDVTRQDRPRVLPARSRAIAGIGMQHDVCSHRAQTFCAVKDRRPTYFGFPVVPDTNVARVIEDAKSRVASLAETKIATAQEPLQRRSDGESAMSNLLADALRSATGADLALVNTLGIRAGFPAGKVTYRDLFAVSPFNNRAVLMGPASTRQVIDILEASLQEMGSPGYLIPSGVRLKYRGTLDTPSARLVLLTLPDGSVLFDDAKGVLVERTFTIATYDYLAGGVSGNAALAGIPVLKNDTGIARELIATELQKRRQALSNTLDGRFGAE